LNLLSKKIGIDLGTSTVLIYVKGEGIVVNEPSLVAVNRDGTRILAIGRQALEMVGRTPDAIQVVRPMREGVIADFVVTEGMLHHFIGKVQGRQRFFKPEIMICVPSGVTSVERRAVTEAAISAGARQAWLIDEPLAAAIGAGLPIAEPVGRMVVDIGGGTSEVAVISLGGLVVSRSLRVGGYDLDEAITSHIRNEHRMAIGSQSAEAIKLAIAAATPQAEELVTEVRGRDLTSGLPREVQLTSSDVQSAIEGPLTDILAAVHAALEETPPELAADITKEGILLAGGGALLRGLVDRLEAETGMPTRVADAPLECVALGAGQSLEELDRMARGRR